MIRHSNLRLATRVTAIPAITLALTLLPAIAQKNKGASFTNWYRQANFYQSPESRVVLVNSQSHQMETAFQVTPEYELQLGAQAFQQLTQGASVVQDPGVQGYLEQMIQKLTSHTPGPNFPYRVVMLNAPNVVNAVTPPGYVVVYSGLVNETQSESELAAALSHELAHNYAHHVARKLVKASYTQMVVSAALQGVSGKSRGVQIVADMAAKLGTGLFLNAYSRFEEKEADLYGTHILFNAGYNPTAMSSLFLRMYQERPKQPIKFLSTHPPDPDRASYITDYLESFPLNQALQLDSVDFQAMKQKLGFQLASAAPPAASNPGVSSLRGSGQGGSSATPPATARTGNSRPPSNAAPPPQQARNNIPYPPSTPQIPSPPSMPPQQGGYQQNRNDGAVARSQPGVPAVATRATPGLPGSPQAITITLPPGAHGVEVGRDGEVHFIQGDPEAAFASSQAARRTGAASGEITWTGLLNKTKAVTIDGSTASSGKLEGALPGMPIILDLPPFLTLVEGPNERNGWKKLVFASQIDVSSQVSISLHWRSK